MSFWVYILRCGDRSYYTGHTDNLELRMVQHEAGTFGGYTEDKKPLELVYWQEVFSRDEALASERQIKRWSRRKKEALINKDWAALRQAAKKNFKSPADQPSGAGGAVSRDPSSAPPSIRPQAGYSG
jgi:predicted GIY-YIG superfamily endonuclease